MFTINNFHRDHYNNLDGRLLRIKVLSNDAMFGTRAGAVGVKYTATVTTLALVVPLPGVCEIRLRDIATGPVHHVEYPVRDGPGKVGSMSVDVVMREVAPIVVAVSNIHLHVDGAPLSNPASTILRLSYVERCKATVFYEVPIGELSGSTAVKNVR